MVNTATRPSPVLILCLVAFTLSCCAFSPFSLDRRVREQELIALAKGELRRHRAVLPKDCSIRVTEHVLIIEITPYEIPLYDVSFYDPRRRRPIPLYSVSIERRTGKIYY